jgi:hypothetical protein
LLDIGRKEQVGRKEERNEKEGKGRIMGTRRKERVLFSP